MSGSEPRYDQCWDCKICETCTYKYLYLKEHPPKNEPVHPLTGEEKEAITAAWNDAVARGVGEEETE